MTSSRTVLIVITALVLSCKGGTPPAPAANGRQPIVLPAEAQDAVRAEMNTMLASLSQILVALPRQDTATIRQAAAASGLATAADPALEKLLPEQFLIWGMQAHQGFDELNASIAAGHPLDTVLVQLGAITRTCVACHATYRLATR
jgi:cytochrome c556